MVRTSYIPKEKLNVQAPSLMQPTGVNKKRAEVYKRQTESGLLPSNACTPAKVVAQAKESINCKECFHFALESSTSSKLMSGAKS